MKKDSLIGKHIKLVFYPQKSDHKLTSPERMWVFVTEDLGGGKHKGILHNTPYVLKSIQHGDTVWFNENMIIDIYDPIKNPPPPEEENPIILPREQQWYPEIYSFIHKNHLNYSLFKKITIYTDEAKVTEGGPVLEELLVEVIGIRKYKIKCIPLFVKKLSYNDTISYLPDSRFEYAIENSNFTSVQLFVEDMDFSFLEPYKDHLIIERELQNSGYVAIAYDNEDQSILQPLINDILEGKKYDYLVNG